MEHLVGIFITAQYTTIPVLGIFFVLFLFRRDSNILLAMLMFYLISNIDSMILLAPKMEIFHGLQWNWQGKLMEVIAIFLLVQLFAPVTCELLGLQLPQERKARIFLMSAFLAMILAICMAILGPHFESSRDVLTPEALFYQLTMPGLSEELVYRGLLQGLLTQYLGQSWEVRGFKFGWSVFLVAIYFTFVHVVSYSASLNQLIVMSNPFDIAMTFVFGFLMGLMREKTKSIWPGVLFHNVINTGSLLLSQ